MPNRCSMCFLERDPTKMRPVMPSLPVKVCGRCSLELDRARGFCETLGVAWQHQLEAPEDLAINGTAEALKGPLSTLTIPKVTIKP